MLKIQKHWKELLIFFVFTLLFFVPRYFAHLQYQALEDEILAIWNNVMYNFSELLLVPDFTHPPLWYLLMDIPTQLIGTERGIFYYRLIQVLILFVLLSATAFYFRKRLNKSLIVTFLILFLTNIYLVHVTSQHRMYAVVLGLSAMYSFAWLHVLEKGLLDSKRWLIALGAIAGLAILINFSAVWNIALWPALSIFYVRQSLKNKLKQLFYFALPFIVLTAGFYPIFWRNAQISVEANQWASPLNLNNVLQVVGSFFGLLLRLSDLNQHNFLVVPVLFAFFATFFYTFSKTKLADKKILFLLMPFILLSFTAYLFLVWITENSLLYARPIISLVVPIYILIALMSIKNPFGKYLAIFIVLAQLSQSIIYFFPTSSKFFEGYDLYNYRVNSIAYFDDFNFKPRDCLLPLPHWNYMAANFFFGKRVQVIDAWFFYEIKKTKPNFDACNDIYILEQFSVQNYEFEKLYSFLFEDSSINLLDTYENQHFYQVNNID